MQAITLALVSIATLGAGSLWMQEAQKQRFTHPVSKDSDGGMARFLATCQPSAAHERLKEMLGSYDVTMRMWMDPSQPPLESKGTSEVTWLADGKWLLSQGSVDVMGQKVSVTAILGYDNFKERYVWCRVDSMQTAMQTASGHFDRSGDDLILWGTIDEPMTPEQDKQVKYVFRGFGKAKCVLEIHDMMIGESNTKVVEVESVRKKK